MKAFGTRFASPFRGEQQSVLPFDECSMKTEERRRLEYDSAARQPSRRDQRDTKPRGDPIQGPEIRGAFSRAAYDDQLLLQQKRLGHDGSSTTGAHEPCNRSQKMDQKNRQITH